MHPYIVVVTDQKKQRLSIPCAESETAELVQKNLQSLFPGSLVSIKSQPKHNELPVNNTTLSLVKSSSVVPASELPRNNYDELEEELFNDVA